MSEPRPSAASFGGYELIGRIGAGGMAETFLAVRRGHGGFEQRVCLKRILPGYEQDAEFVQMFLSEAKVSARLRHANVVQVLDFGVEGRSHFLALELIEGTDLRRLLTALGTRSERIAPGLVAYLAVELGRALQYAHRQGVIHRDISPGNVLLSNAGEVKLSDFGIARAADLPGVTRTGVVKGKVHYMAPEYALTGKLDARGDLYSLGVTLYEALAGARPHDGVTDLETIDRASRGAHQHLAERVPQAAAALAHAIEQLLVPDPEARFQTADAFLRALTSAQPPPAADQELAGLVSAHMEHPEPSPILAVPGSEVRERVDRLPDAPLPVAAPAAEQRGRLRPIAILFAVAAMSGAIAVGLTVWTLTSGDEKPPKERTEATPPPPAQPPVQGPARVSPMEELFEEDDAVEDEAPTVAPSASHSVAELAAIDTTVDAAASRAHMLSLFPDAEVDETEYTVRLVHPIFVRAFLEWDSPGPGPTLALYWNEEPAHQDDAILRCLTPLIGQPQEMDEVRVWPEGAGTMVLSDVVLVIPAQRRPERWRQLVTALHACGPQP